MEILWGRRLSGESLMAGGGDGLILPEMERLSALPECAMPHSVLFRWSGCRVVDSVEISGGDYPE